MRTNVKGESKGRTREKEEKPDQSKDKKSVQFGPLLPNFALKRRAYIEAQYKNYGIKKRKTAIVR